MLAIDPGFGRCGVAVLENMEVLASDCIETHATTPFANRLFSVVCGAETLIQKYTPHTLVLETLFFTNNQKTAMHVAEIRGALIYLATSRDMTIVEYAPRQVKQAVTGNGNADKTAMMSMVERLVTLPKKKMLDDEYDAIALGIAYSALGDISS